MFSSVATPESCSMNTVVIVTTSTTTVVASINSRQVDGGWPIKSKQVALSCRTTEYWAGNVALYSIFRLSMRVDVVLVRATL